MTVPRSWVVGLAAGTLALGGCGGTQDEAAGTAAERLLTAAARGDGAAACEVLAPAARSELEKTSGKSCAKAVLEEDLGRGGPARVTVFDTMAQAVLGQDTVFLSRFDDEWLVVAAACTAVPSRPYDCSIGLP